MYITYPPLLISLIIILTLSLIVFIKINFIPTEKFEQIQNFYSNSTKKVKLIKNNNNINYHIPKFMLELYENNNKFSGRNVSGVRAEIVRSLIPKHARKLNGDSAEFINQNHLLVFELPNRVEDDEEFVGAELRILTLIQMDSNEKINGIERSIKVSVFDDTTQNLYGLEKIHICHWNNTWVTFNVTKAVNKLLQKPKRKSLKLVISVQAFLSRKKFSKDQNFIDLSLMPLENNNFEHDYPILLLSYTNKKSKNIENVRKKRSFEDDYEEDTNRIWTNEKTVDQWKKMKKSKNTCRKKPLYVNFEEIDYDIWIVQPRGYEAYQCQGKCFYPVADHLNPTKHAIVQALLHSVSPAKASRSCCVPTVLDSISILYVDNNGVLTYRYAYKDMVVVECGCR